MVTLSTLYSDAELVYSDARVIDRRGRLISDTYWSRRRNNHSDLLSLLVANAVTGAASLFRAEVLKDALPFPPAQFAHFHDHWVALTALAGGDIAFVDRPLYDYVQHGQAALGHAAATRMPRLRSRLGALRRDRRERVRMWRLHYFVDGCRLLQYATILDIPAEPDPLWGTGNHVLWSKGEGLMIYAPQGVGKTSIAQQLVNFASDFAEASDEKRAALPQILSLDA